MYDLGQAFIEEGHQVTIITPSNDLKGKFKIELQDGVRLVQVRALKTKDVNYVYRTLAEFINPFLIWHKLKKSPEFLSTQYDGIIWYSPTIFWGPLIKGLKLQFHVKAYLILRDIFPDWAHDLGLIKKGLVYKFLKAVERFQYQQADTIGVQSPNNLKYFKERNQELKAYTEVLWNWMGQIQESECSIDLTKTVLAGRQILIYAGNMGVAQGLLRFLELARDLQDQKDVGFVFIGRGSELRALRHKSEYWGLENVLFYDEIANKEILGLLRQCSAGLVSLDPRLKSHNIPGKVLSYLMADLPIFGMVNQGNDLIEFIREYKLGRVVDGLDTSLVSMEFINFLDDLRSSNFRSLRSESVAKERFTSKFTAQAIAWALSRSKLSV
jgi:hypothetical protein